MKTRYQSLLIFFFLFFINFSCFSQIEWFEKMLELNYSPRYFGPNAFPVPVLRNGLTYDRFEAEVRWEYHYCKGDKTNDWFIRGVIPFVKGKAAMEITYVAQEKYAMTCATLKERQINGSKTSGKNGGDMIISAIFQILKKPEWVDVLVSATIKTATGDELKQARFTDAASYWFDVNVAKEIYRNEAYDFSLRLQALGGFYCWMTYGLPHRQNDGPSFGFGLTASYRDFIFSSDFAGFSGYEHNGDNSRILRNNLRYEYKKNILSLNYNYGMMDNLYQTFSVGYIRCF